MATIKPFKGFRYNTEKAGPLEELVSPPYDVISENAEKSYYLRNQYNIIRLDITKNRPTEPGSYSSRYDEPELLLKKMVDENILVSDQEESIYSYDIEYSLSGLKRLVRRGFVCLVELSEFKKRIIRPHEKTFSGVVDDRLELTRRCRAQFSKVFGVYSDKDNEIIDALTAADSVDAGSVVDADGNVHTLGKIDDPAVILKVTELMKQKCIYIADGHHRYTTALSFRDEQRKKGLISDESPENFIMMYLTPVEDSGLCILPTHRLVMAEAGLQISCLIDAMEKFFHVEEICGGSREILASGLLDAMREQSEDGSLCLGLYYPGEDRGWVLRLIADTGSIFENIHQSVRNLDVTILSELLIKRILKIEHVGKDLENLVSYYSDIEEIIDDSVKKAVHIQNYTPLVFLLNATRIEQVLEVSDASQTMPHKSTYFYPKITSGLVLNLFGPRIT